MFSNLFYSNNGPKTYSSMIEAKKKYLEYINTAKKTVTDIKETLSALNLTDIVTSYAEYALDFTVEKIFGSIIGKMISPKIKEAIQYIPTYVDSATQNLEASINTVYDYSDNAAKIELDFAHTEEEGSIVLVGVESSC
ncbi:hypothetical protein [Rickettsia oklahomensis]|uniref:Uncharacterized protein n=1 Tax=Rickettsia oklahomensis TaxID=3141789 RepID=A0AAU7C0C3_9RICK